MLRPRRIRVPLKPRIAFAIKRAREFLIETNTRRLPIDPFSYFDRFDWTLLKWSELHSASCPDPFLLRKNKADARAVRTSDNEFIVVYDDFVKPRGRVLFTIAHEIAHIYLGHLTDFEETMLNRGGLKNEQYKVLEREADAFASELLSPLFVLDAIIIKSPDHLVELCQLSNMAAENRYNYIQTASRFKTSNKPDLCNHFADFIMECNPFAAVAVSVEQQSLFDNDEVIEFSYEDLDPDDGIPTDENGRLLFCPKCFNDQFKPGASHCKRCGEYLYNQCSDDGWFGKCGHPASGSDRFCQLCGAPTRLLLAGYLTPWSFYDRLL